MSYRTIILPFYVTDQDFELIINTCKIFKQAVCDLLDKILELAELEVEFLQSLKSFKGKWYKIVYKSIPNKYYAESCCEFVYEIGKSLLKLAPFYAEDSVDKYDWFYSKLYEVELGDWLLFECRGFGSVYAFIYFYIFSSSFYLTHVLCIFFIPSLPLVGARPTPGLPPHVSEVPGFDLTPK